MGNYKKLKVLALVGLLAGSNLSCNDNTASDIIKSGALPSVCFLVWGGLYFSYLHHKQRVKELKKIKKGVAAVLEKTPVVTRFLDGDGDIRATIYKSHFFFRLYKKAFGVIKAVEKETLINFNKTNNQLVTASKREGIFFGLQVAALLAASVTTLLWVKANGNFWKQTAS